MSTRVSDGELRYFLANAKFAGRTKKQDQINVGLDLRDARVRIAHLESRITNIVAGSRCLFDSSERLPDDKLLCSSCGSGPCNEGYRFVEGSDVIT